MKVVEIESYDSEEISVYARLTEAQLRNRLEPEKGIFIAESPNVIRCALQAGIVPISFLVESQYLQSHQSLFAEFGDLDVPIYTADRHIVANIAGYEVTRGFLCAMHRPLLPSLSDICCGKRRVAVIDGVVNSTNIGAIFRAASSLGIDALLVVSNCCDPFNRRSVRVSMGSIFRIPWTIVGNDYLDKLKILGFKLISLALRDDALAIDDLVLKSCEKLAIIMGNEGIGLSDSTIDKTDYTAVIPMKNGVDSLNVAAAAAVAFWELRVL